MRERKMRMRQKREKDGRKLLREQKKKKGLNDEICKSREKKNKKR